jgi:hypothetical protein
MRRGQSEVAAAKLQPRLSLDWHHWRNACFLLPITLQRIGLKTALRCPRRSVLLCPRPIHD